VVLEQNSRRVLAGAEVQHANEQLAACGPKCWSRIIGGFQRRRNYVGRIRKSPVCQAISVNWLKFSVCEVDEVRPASFQSRLANVAVRDSSDNFTFVIGDHRYQFPLLVAQFLSTFIPRCSNYCSTTKCSLSQQTSSRRFVASPRRTAVCRRSPTTSGLASRHRHSSPNITFENGGDLPVLCDEFHFSNQLEDWLSSHSAYSSSARWQIFFLDSRIHFLKASKRMELTL
jgi:hypothetical protein